MKMIRLIPILLLVLGMTTTTMAQKVGHIDSNALLTQLPEMKSANSTLETFRTQKLKEAETRMKKIQEFYVANMQKIQEGTLSPVEQQQKETELQRQQAEFKKYEADIQQQIMSKQEQLYQPILDKVNAAIKRVGEQNGFDYIMDSSFGALVYMEDKHDVTELVKKELGI